MGTGGFQDAGGRMRVMDAVQASIDRTRTMLFEPFDFERWLTFGVIAFLDIFLAGGGLSRSGARFSGQGQGGSQSSPNLDGVAEWLGENAVLIVMIAVPLILIALAIHVGLMYVGCRGQVMFVRSVSMNGGKLGEHWSAVKQPAWSLFLFRLGLLAVWLVFVLVLILFFLVAVGLQGGFRSGEALLYTLIPFGLVVVAGWVVLALIQVMLRAFVVPLMWARDLSCTEAWQVFVPLAKANAGSLAGFVLIKIAYSIGFSIATLFVGCLTCCIGLLPVVHHTLFAPFYVFDRAFPMEMLAMSGEDEGTLFAPVPYEAPPPLVR
ncbi:MAG: hypothetical protein AMXMBFR82_25350 [Candidatus Hydrogenedentota bacterium]